MSLDAGGCQRTLPSSIVRKSIITTVFTVLLSSCYRSPVNVLSDLPNPNLTPGNAASTDTTEVCVIGYARNSFISDDSKRYVYSRYGVHYVPHTAEMDHLIPLELGGSNTVDNLWPEPFDTIWNAHVKDTLEDRIEQLVCSGQINLIEAQTAISNNWIDLYKKVFHTELPPS